MLGVHPVRAESDTEGAAFPIPHRNVPQEIHHEPVRKKITIFINHLSYFLCSSIKLFFTSDTPWFKGPYTRRNSLYNAGSRYFYTIAIISAGNIFFQRERIQPRRRRRRSDTLATLYTSPYACLTFFSITPCSTRQQRIHPRRSDSVAILYSSAYTCLTITITSSGNYIFFIVYQRNT